MQSTCLEASTRQLPHCQADISGVKYLLRSKYSPLDQRQVTSSCAKTHGQTPTASLGPLNRFSTAWRQNRFLPAEFCSVVCSDVLETVPSALTGLERPCAICRRSRAHCFAKLSGLFHLEHDTGSPARTIERVRGAAMGLRDAADEGKPEPERPDIGAALLGSPIERLEGSLLIPVRESGPSVVRFERNRAEPLLDPQRQKPSAVAHRIVDQIRQCPSDQRGIAQEAGTRRFNAEHRGIDTGPLERPDRRLDRIQLDRLEGREIQPRARQKLTHQGIDLHHLSLQLVERLVVGSALARKLDQQANPGQRGSKLMGNGGE